MASISTDRNGNRTIQFVAHDGKRRSIRPGKVPLKVANEIKLKVEALNLAQSAGVPLDMDTAAWVARLGDDLADKLAAVGLTPARGRATLDDFVRGYIAGRTDAKESTRVSMGLARQRLVAFFGPDRPLRDINPGEVDRWVIDMKANRKYAEATVSRTIKRARQFFTAARRDHLVSANPFEHVKPGVMHNADRWHFVTREDAEKILAACPDAEWRLIVALSRHGGLRCPSEHLALTWADVDWERARFLVRSSKQEHYGSKGRRWVPLFPELRAHLEALWDAAPPGTVHVINRYRDAKQNLRTTFEKIIYRAGLTPWPRLFQNLRASRETELAEAFPIHVVAAWIGNTASVAMKHYLNVTEAHFEKAVRREAVQNPVQSGDGRARQEVSGSQPRPSEGHSGQVNAAPGIYCPNIHMAAVGLEPTRPVRGRGF